MSFRIFVGARQFKRGKGFIHVRASEKASSGKGIRVMRRIWAGRNGGELVLNRAERTSKKHKGGIREKGSTLGDLELSWNIPNS